MLDTDKPVDGPLPGIHRSSRGGVRRARQPVRPKSAGAGGHDHAPRTHHGLHAGATQGGGSPAPGDRRRPATRDAVAAGHRSLDLQRLRGGLRRNVRCGQRGDHELPNVGTESHDRTREPRAGIGDDRRHLGIAGDDRPWCRTRGQPPRRPAARLGPGPSGPCVGASGGGASRRRRPVVQRAAGRGRLGRGGCPSFSGLRPDHHRSQTRRSCVRHAKRRRTRRGCQSGSIAERHRSWHGRTPPQLQHRPGSTASVPSNAITACGAPGRCTTRSVGAMRMS